MEAWGNLDKSNEDSEIATSDLKIIKEISITDDMWLDLVKEDPDTIFWKSNPSEELQLAAVKQDIYDIYDIDNPSKEAKEAAKQNM